LQPGNVSDDFRLLTTAFAASVDFDSPGGMRQIHGRFTASRNGWRWQPAY
jgi:hypothetical protein